MMKYENNKTAQQILDEIDEDLRIQKKNVLGLLKDVEKQIDRHQQ